MNTASSLLSCPAVVFANLLPRFARALLPGPTDRAAAADSQRKEGAAPASRTPDTGVSDGLRPDATG